MHVTDLQTPCLVLNEKRMDRNVARLQRHLRSLGVVLRPHLKTCKSIDIALRVMSSAEGPVAVSTLKEAESSAACGVTDILYAVGIAPAKLSRVLALRRSGAGLMVVIDSLEQARSVTEAAAAANDPIPVLIEIDSDGHRSGVPPKDKLLIEIGRSLLAGRAKLRGVMTHAGGSYGCATTDGIAVAAEQERRAAVDSAEALRSAGMPCEIVSVGSTPTAHFARDLHGVTEVRAGVFVFFDLVMAGLSVCSIDDIALSVLATVIGHQTRKGCVIVDAGWMALSRDRGTSALAIDQGYGVVCDLHGTLFPDLIVVAANQEHGIISVRPGSSALIPNLPLGTQVRILPNHACATAAQHPEYNVVDEETLSVIKRWPRFSGW